MKLVMTIHMEIKISVHVVPNHRYSDNWLSHMVMMVCASSIQESGHVATQTEKTEHISPDSFPFDINSFHSIDEA